jgi:hypothetical protein
MTELGQALLQHVGSTKKGKHIADGVSGNEAGSSNVQHQQQEAQDELGDVDGDEDSVSVCDADEDNGDDPLQ